MYPCAFGDCTYISVSRRGLGVHRSTCRFRAATFTNDFNKRALDDDEDEQRHKRARTEEPGDEENEVSRFFAPPSPPALPPSPPPPQTRSGRHIRVPKRLIDYIPTNRDDLPQHVANAFPEPPPVASPQRYVSPTVEDVPEEEEQLFQTAPDSFGLYREYTVLPQRDPEGAVFLSSRCDAPTLDNADSADDKAPGYKSIFWLTRGCAIRVDNTGDTDGALGPFANKSQFRVYDWFYNSSLTKSMDDLDDLLDVLCSDGFSLEGLEGFSAHTAQKTIDEYQPEGGVFSADDGWVHSSVEIPLPKPKVKYASEAAAPTFKVDGIHHRKLTEVMRGAAQDARFAHQYHWIPHMLFWKPPAPEHAAETPPCPSPSPASPSPSSPSPSPASPSPEPESSSSGPFRVFTDVYNSDRMHREYEKIRSKPRNPADGPHVETVICGLMLWSDATHLTSFGAAALWPIYLYLGNLSKYIRGMPTEFAAHHLAYIPSLPDQLKEFYTRVYGVPPSKDVLTFCKRELMQRIWLLLLDDDFLDAYENGILVTCGDGVVRRIFPRFFSYSADYPEKILLTALKPLAKHPCPRCLIDHDDLCDAGTPEDSARRANIRVDSEALRKKIARARKLVFEKGCALNSKKVQKLLGAESLNPIQSAFSARLAKFGLNFYELFVPDLMHEFELGVWKGTFIHLLRLLAAQGEGAVQEYNRRMRATPTFGLDKIRKFWHDVSARKQLAARDYEDFLICMLPAYEGLLPDGDDETTQDLLFELATWHALAKLRLHTEITVDIFRGATTHMTEAMRVFANTTCQHYETRELAQEVEARVRNAEKTGKATNSRERKVVAFNVLNTFKYHTLPDYPGYIQETATHDNANTQVGELEHRHVKRFYARTNKIRYCFQIAKHQRRAALLRALRSEDDYTPRRVRLRSKRERARAKAKTPTVLCSDLGGQDTDMRPDTPLPPTDPLDHYAISQSQRLPIRLHNWLAGHDDDPAAIDFIPRLREHLLSRILDSESTHGPLFAQRQLDGIELENDRIFRHKLLRVNYTTYDVRRDQDVINPRTHADVMVLADGPQDPSHPFWHARVIDIFHANVRYTGPGSTRFTRRFHRMDFLWVRWFKLDDDYSSGFQARRLPRLRFVDPRQDNEAAFGFIDPSEVLRGAYLIPAFVHSTTEDLLGPSKLARRASDNNEDFVYYYACIFVDRDMFMRYLGGGVGHRGNGVDWKTSYQHSLRLTPAGGHLPSVSRSRSSSLEYADAPAADQEHNGDHMNTDDSQGELEPHDHGDHVAYPPRPLDSPPYTGSTVIADGPLWASSLRGEPAQTSHDSDLDSDSNSSKSSRSGLHHPAGETGAEDVASDVFENVGDADADAWDEDVDAEAYEWGVDADEPDADGADDEADDFDSAGEADPDEEDYYHDPVYAEFGYAPL